MSLNKTFIMGRLTKDPERRSTQEGTPVATFTVAVDRDFKSKDGERKADFFPVVAWRSTAEFVTKYFTKGSMVIVVGRLQPRSYTNKNGIDRYVTEIIADNVYFGESKRRDSVDVDAPAEYGEAEYCDDSDLPF